MVNIIHRKEEKVITEDLLDISIKGINKTISLEELLRKKNIKISDKKIGIKSKILDTIQINEKKYFLYAGKNEKVFITNNINYFCKVKQFIKCKITKKHIYFWGIFTNISHKIDGFENIYLNNEMVGKIKRISNLKKIKNLMFMRIEISKIMNSGEIHNNIRIGQNQEISVPLLMKKKHSGMNYYKYKKIDDNLMLVRSTTDGRKAIITNVKFEPEYKKINLLKNFIASKTYRIFRKSKNKVILMFEKCSGKADESAYYMFSKIMNKKNAGEIDSNVYFIIDKNSKDYQKVKKEYGKNIVEKYSFRHYIYIYMSNYFISSELPNHVVNARLYIRSLNKCIEKKPLIFLQHGIMFAKPVDNPAAKGFYKSNSKINIYRSVISSELEAEQFMRMGYEREELIKCGLTKFDTSYLREDAEKIMFMPTYRYWEEALIMDESKIKETTYYKSYMDVIKKFEEANLLDRLIVTCHPKFAECLEKASPEYSKIIEKDINQGLENSRIFITDYSSASYDAHYRGAYIIYYWAEKDYLIENYKAIPPVNEENCDGVPVYSTEELIKAVNEAIEKKYIMDELYQERYKKINEFSDGKNGDRLIEELIKLNVI